jgi:hypothetical protein
VKDRKGNEISVGDRVYVMPHHDIGGFGFVRRVSGEKARIDDGPKNMAAVLPDAPEDDWNWSAWCKSDEFEKDGAQ